jgi:hypothetical protein
MSAATERVPDRANVIALEWQAQIVGMLSGKAGQRHRQVEPQTHPAVALVLEFIKLFIRFLAAFAREDF